jgi:hypothetical protein
MGCLTVACVATSGSLAHAEEPERRFAILPLRPRPDVGAPPEEIRAYLDELMDAVTLARRSLREAERDEDEARIAESKLLLKNALALHGEERDRLMTRDWPSVAAGTTLVTAGGVALITAFVLGTVQVVTPDDEPPPFPSALPLGLLIAGFPTLGAGIPFIVLGAARRPRQPDAPASTGWLAPQVGLTFQLDL